MSDGASQLFDPDEAAVPDAGGAEPEDRRGVHSIGGVYEQVEGALNQAFPRNRHLWVRGEIQHVSDHRSGHLYMSLVDPEEHLVLEGLSDSAWRERIGNAVPPEAAQAIASVMGRTILMARSGMSFILSSEPIWVQPIALALAVDDFGSAIEVA